MWFYIPSCLLLCLWVLPKLSSQASEYFSSSVFLACLECLCLIALARSLHYLLPTHAWDADSLHLVADSSTSTWIHLRGSQANIGLPEMRWFWLLLVLSFLFAVTFQRTHRPTLFQPVWGWFWKKALGTTFLCHALNATRKDKSQVKVQCFLSWRQLLKHLQVLWTSSICIHLEHWRGATSLSHQVHPQKELATF